MMESSYENIGVTVMTPRSCRKGQLIPVIVDNYICNFSEVARSTHNRHRATLHLLLLSSMKMFLVCTFVEFTITWCTASS